MCSAYRSYIACFNPHRLLGVGATHWRVLTRTDHANVSILTDSWESVQRTSGFGQEIRQLQFQSSPTPGSRCNLWVSMSGELLVDAFQSSPTPGSRCNPGHCQLAVAARVSILTDSWESVQPPRARYGQPTT